MFPLLLLFLPLALVAGRTSTSTTADYHERLLLRPLPQSALLASFNFRSNDSSTAFDEQNFRFFPRSLGQIVQHTHTKELHLRFSLGRWDSETWGARPWAGAREGGTGVELWAWVEADSEELATSRWLTLTNALSGLFCASLNFIDSTKTIRPVTSFEPEGDHKVSSNLHLLHGTLPHEVVCTENLTPFIKLLPCKGKAGISSLLDGHKLFDASWQTMAVDVRPVCPLDGSGCVVEMEQTVDMVLDIERAKRPRDNPIPRPRPVEDFVCDESKSYNSPDSCFPVNGNVEPEWTLAKVFGRALQGACPLVSNEGPGSETVCLSVVAERTVSIQSNGSYQEHRRESDLLRCYKLPTGDDFDLHLPEQALSAQLPLDDPGLYAARFITGHGQERGGIQAVLTNPSRTNSLDVAYLESLPWFMKPYLHTLRATINQDGVQDTRGNPIQETYYRPAVDRHRGTHLELILTIPPASTVTLTYDFEKAILRYTEYPPDANRGFDAAPAVVRVLRSSEPIPGADAQKGVYLRTTSLLLYLPTPDFSMPYNVIILTSTVMALGFGNIFNLLVRRFVGSDEVEGWKAGALSGLLTGKVERLRTRLSGKGAKTE